MERYNPVEGRWERRAAMLQGRSCFCAVGLEDAVYALGGYGPPCLSRLVDRLTSHPQHTNNPTHYILTTMGLDRLVGCCVNGWSVRSMSSVCNVEYYLNSMWLYCIPSQY